MAESAQVASLNYSHEAIMDWLLSNPDKDQGECARAFGYTQSWLSTIIHSDAFRAEYQRRRAQLSEYIAQGIQTRMAEVSKKALDHLEQYLDGEEIDPRLVLDIADRTLHRQGYAPNKGGVAIFAQQNNFANPNAVDRATLTEARGILRSINGGNIEAPALEHDSHSGEK